MKPQRIQQRRTKGWRMPANAKYVGRPSRWGNQYVVERTPSGAFIVVRTDGGLPTGTSGAGFPDKVAAAARAVALHRQALEDAFEGPSGSTRREAYLGELSGLNLSCWCPLGQPCHADTLIELANP